jgi:hypothetical protein
VKRTNHGDGGPKKAKGEPSPLPFRPEFGQSAYGLGKVA